MSGPIYDFFTLVLTSFLDLVLDSVYKSPKLSETMLKKDLKLFLYDDLSSYAFDFAFVLLPIV